MYRSLLTVSLSVLVGLSSASANAALVLINRDNAVNPAGGSPTEPEEAGTYVFTNLHASDSPVPSLSSTDLANGIAPVVLLGTLGSGAGSEVRLTDGTGAANANDLPGNILFNDNIAEGRIRISLSAPTAIGAINTYSWYRGAGNQAHRAVQYYDVYGAGSGANLADDATNISDYTLIASVDTLWPGSDTTSSNNVNANQTGVSIIPNVGNSLGTFQHFVFVIRRRNGANSTFFSEFDIVAAPTVDIPEPGTFALFAMGLVPIVAVARRRRNRKV